jgi:hypothetical protein
MAFAVSCSDGDNGGGSGELVKKARITGVFQKGPFVKGTMATLNELNNNLSPTGRPYQTLITDDKGTFELKDVELVSPYVHLIATGYFQNEVTGNKSNGPITLQAIVDVTDKDNINVNVITHLEYYRVIDLVEGGMTVKAAKKQAQREIFAVFGIDSDGFKDSEDMTIFGESESDAALLAVSVLLLGDLGEADFTERIMDFSQGIRNGGVWSNEEAKEAMAAWAFRYWASYFTEQNNTIRDNILRWGLVSEVPDFEKYLYDYWVAGYGLGVCNAEEEFVVKEFFVRNNYFGREYSEIVVCKNGIWAMAKGNDKYCYEYKDCDNFTDPRDGKIYRTVVRGTLNQTWMIDELRYEGEDGNLGAYYDDDLFYYYSYASLENALIACPNGWHLPNDYEIEAISNLIPPTIFWGNTSLWVLQNDGYWKKEKDPTPFITPPVYCVKD